MLVEGATFAQLAQMHVLGYYRKSWSFQLVRTTASHVDLYTIPIEWQRPLLKTPLMVFLPSIGSEIRAETSHRFLRLLWAYSRLEIAELCSVSRSREKNDGCALVNDRGSHCPVDSEEILVQRLVQSNLHLACTSLTSGCLRLLIRVLSSSSEILNDPSGISALADSCSPDPKTAAYRGSLASEISFSYVWERC